MTYLTAATISDIPGISEVVAQAAIAAAMIGAGIGFVIKSGIYCGLAYYLSRPQIQALYARKKTSPVYA